MKRLHWYRRGVQLLVIALFCALPWLNSSGFGQIKGSLFASEFFGVPLADPVTVAQVALSGGMNDSWPVASFYAGALLALLLAFACGRIFCGWICPYGLFSEVLTGARKKKARSWRHGLWLKSVVFLGIIAAGCLFSYPAASLLSMPGQISLVPLYFSSGAEYGLLAGILLVPLIFLALETIAGSRIWCTHLCPQSLLLGLAAQLRPAQIPGLRINWNPDLCSCGRKSPCSDKCSLGLKPRHRNGPHPGDCTLCGKCVQTCRENGGALSFGLCRKSADRTGIGDKS